MVLVDWTRMGKTYCLAGAVLQGGQVRIVRPLLARHREAVERNAGWSPYLLDGHRRWEVYDLIAPEPAPPEPPHLEDVSVRSLRPWGRLVTPEHRRLILEATRVRPGEPLFGVRLTPSLRAAYLEPGTGTRSLATLVVPAGQITFRASYRDGAAGPDVRVTLHVPGLETRQLPVKDHHLLCRAEQHAGDLPGLVRELQAAISRMGGEVAVRLGLSRAFPPRPDCDRGFCWLMADGFFSLTDPQP
jgi:hypothetical protein